MTGAGDSFGVWHRRKSNSNNYQAQLAGCGIAAKDALQDLMHWTIETINDDSLYLSTEIIKTIPEEVKVRSLHFSNTTTLCVSTWAIEEPDLGDFSLIVEKFYETYPYGSPDDVWRVSGPDWMVSFLTRRSLDSAGGIDVSTDWLWNPGAGNPRRKYFNNGTAFGIVGPSGFTRDIVIRKLSQ